MTKIVMIALLYKTNLIYRINHGQEKSIFCTKDDGDLHESRIFNADDNVRRLATIICNTAI